MDIFKSTVAALVLAGSLIAPIHADEYEDQIKALLVFVAMAAEEEGYEVALEPYMDVLDDSAHDGLSLTLEGGTEYKIIGVCDSDCSDIDMHLQDGDGNLVARDQSDDDVPIVDVSPGQTASYQLIVVMHECSAEPCHYGVVALKR